MTYDLAFALVWATGDEVLNVNEAHAYASCSNCVTVAVAFQVVLIMDDAQVVVPQNLSVAANYECYRCITAAIASQLVLSVEETPGEEQLRALGEVWGRLTEFGKSITTYSLSEISTRLEAFKAEIVAILGDAPPMCPTRHPHRHCRPPGRPPTSAASRRRRARPPHRRPARPRITDEHAHLITDEHPATSPTSTSATSPTSSPDANDTTTTPTPEPTTEPTTAASSPEPSAATTTSSPSPSP